MSRRADTSLPAYAALDVHIKALVENAVRDALRKGGAGVDPDPWVGHPKWVEWGLCPSKRAACALARSGALHGVKRLPTGVYVVRRSVLDAWIEAHPIDTSSDEPADDYEREMARRGLGAKAAKDAPPARVRRASSSAEPSHENHEGRRVEPARVAAKSPTNAPKRTQGADT